MKSLNLNQYRNLFKAYTELRVQENRSTRISFVKGHNVANSRSAVSGVCARSYSNGSWGFASSPELNQESVSSVIKTATNNALFLDSRENKNKGPLPEVPATSENDFSTKKARLSQKDLLDFAKEIDRHIETVYPELASRVVTVNCLDMEKLLVTSDGSYSHSMIPRAFISIGMSVMKDGQPIELYQPYGGFGQFEDVFTSPSDLFDEFEKQYQELIKKSQGVYAEAGVKTCVLDAELAGILAHEAIGHTVEADMVLGGSVAANKIEKTVASPLVTLVDFANSFNGNLCPVPVFIDDEGTKAQDAVIIEKGILRNYLHNKESAANFGVLPMGNARAFEFSDEPLIRMRNTAILPGEDKLEDMIASIEDGYYLIKPGNGQADSTSEFMFAVNLGYEIKNGKIGKAIRDTTISGIAFDVLKTVTMVSDNMHWTSSGMCGKKQPIPVGMGGPAIKCKINIGGR